LFVILITGFITGIPSWARSQIASSHTSVDEIIILVNEKPASEEFRDLIALEKGEPFSLKKINQSIKQLYRTGLFSDIRVNKKGQQGEILVFSLIRKILIKSINFVTREKIPEKKIKESLYEFREGDVYSPQKLEAADEDLKTILLEEGYNFDRIDTVVNEIENGFFVDVLFKISSVRRFRIETISFDGEIILKESELKNKMESQEGKSFVLEALENDIERLKKI
jgi:outer membrane protein insertion porin family